MSYIEDCVAGFHEQCMKLQEELANERTKSALLKDRLYRVQRLIDREEAEEAKADGKKAYIKGTLDVAISSAELREAIGYPDNIGEII